MSKPRSKRAGLPIGERFAYVVYEVLDCENFHQLSGTASKMLLELCRQYTGYNNGALKAPWTIMARRGWRSKATVEIAVKELLYYGFISLTRQGGRNASNLYALTWRGIDRRDGLDVSCGPAASRRYLHTMPRFKRSSTKVNPRFQVDLPQKRGHSTPNIVLLNG